MVDEPILRLLDTILRRKSGENAVNMAVSVTHLCSADCRPTYVSGLLELCFLSLFGLVLMLMPSGHRAWDMSQ